MATDVIMPQMGESIAEGTITKWLVKLVARVERDQPLFEISTDKVDAEIPSPADGILLEVKFDEGDTVPVDEVVAILGEEGEQPEAAGKTDGEDGDEETPTATASEAEDEASAQAEPDGPERDDAAEEVEREPADDQQDDGPVTRDEAERVRRFSSPVVRKMAAEHGVDLGAVEGTGIHGRVTRRDLETYLEKGSGAAAEEVAETGESVVPRVAAKREAGSFSVPAYSSSENVEIVPMSKIRQITAAHMVYSKATSAHVTTVFHMDLARVARVRNQAKAGFLEAHGTKLTYMPFIFQAVTSALKANPVLNAAVDGTDIVYKKDINLGMAVAMDRGLIVPVLKHADQLNLVGLARGANDLADRARNKKLKPEEVQGGTFTVTNPGVFGSLFGTPIINQPQVAILGLGVIEKRPVVVSDEDGNDNIAIRPMSYFAITYDHRVIDGANADHFMNDVKRTLLEETWGELDPFL